MVHSCPLGQITTSGIPVRAGLYDLEAGYEGITAFGIKVYHASTTPEIPHNASASDLEELLETLPTVGQVIIPMHTCFSD